LNLLLLLLRLKLLRLISRLLHPHLRCLGSVLTRNCRHRRNTILSRLNGRRLQSISGSLTLQELRLLLELLLWWWCLLLLRLLYAHVFWHGEAG